MIITNPLIYIYLGGCIRYLAGRRAGNRIIEKDLIYENLLALKEEINNLGFRVTENLYDKILASLESDFNKLSEIDDINEDDNRLSAEQSEILMKNIISLEETLVCESQEKMIDAPVPRKSSLDHLLIC